MDGGSCAHQRGEQTEAIEAMWRCSNCHESVDDTFAICWHCGAAADGTLDSDFTPEPDDPAVRDPGEDADSEAVADQLRAASS